MFWKKVRIGVGVCVIAANLVLIPVVSAQDEVPQLDDMGTGYRQVKPPEKSYSPFAGESYPQNVYWGDTHLHTSNSFDAGFINFRAGTPSIRRQKTRRFVALGLIALPSWRR
jgi:hypothetical protein